MCRVFLLMFLVGFLLMLLGLTFSTCVVGIEAKPSSSSTFQALSPLECSHAPNCTACYELSGCHWCRQKNGTSTCNAYASWYGCAVGQICFDQTGPCVRSQSQWKGYGKPSTSVTMIGIILGLLLLSSLGCLCFCLSYYTEKRSRAHTQRQMDRIRTAVAAAGGGHAGGAGGVSEDDSGHYIQLSSLTGKPRRGSHESLSRPTARSIESDDSDEEVETLYGDGPTEQKHAKKERLLEQPERPRKVSTRNVMVNSPASPSPSSTDDDISLIDLSSSFTPPPPSKRQRYCLRFVYGFIIFGMIGIIVGMIVGILFYPQIPQYSMCARTIEWDTIMRYIKEEWRLKADVDMQFAIYNPNRFDVHVTEAIATISYKGSNIMSGTLTNHDFPAGTITDVWITNQFQPESSTQAVALYEDHKAGKLLVDIGMEIKTSESIFHRTFYTYNTSLSIQGVDTSIQDTKQYCLCKDETKNTGMSARI